MTAPSPTFTFIYKANLLSWSAISPLKIQLDVHLPTSVSPISAVPVIFALHPGGLVGYDRTWLPPWVFDLAQEKGWAVVAPDYRLLVGDGPDKRPGVGLDAGDVLDDALDAYKWAFGGPLAQALKSEGADLTLDPSRVTILGLSAGGWLGPLLCSMIPKSGLPSPASQLLLYPVTRPFSPFYNVAKTRGAPDAIGLSDDYIETAHRYWTRTTLEPAVTGSIPLLETEKRELEKKDAQGHRGMIYDWMIEKGIFSTFILGLGIEEFTGKGKNDGQPSSVISALLARLTPLVGDNAANASYPPTFVIHGLKDSLVPYTDAEFVRDALKTAGVTVELVLVPEVDHGFEGRLHLDGGSEWDGLMRQVGTWLEAQFSAKA